jgi:hypothetical protein
MSEARKRLEEARYFLSRMKENVPSPTINFDSRLFAFTCDLNAFISFARSVTSLPLSFSGRGMFVLENEFANTKGFTDWHKKQVENLKNDVLAHFFATKRTVSVHHRSLQPHRAISAISFETIPVFSFGHVVSTPANTTEEEVNRIVSEAQQYEPPSPSISVQSVPVINELIWFFNELLGGMTPQNEVVTVCEKYLAAIERLLGDWELSQEGKR